ncbi:hypothetical protein AMJ85_08455 [candidate division BRC1 bacterium SM23_51]|nr:MAG: hypothetical protein AMJ85_08455 [candidate division BRC1 bacterium SM23_51]
MFFYKRTAIGLLLAASLVAAVGVAGVKKPTDNSRERMLGAREIAALLDMQAMRDAEVWAYLDTGYLHTLENLNDILGFETNYDFDDIMDGGGALVISLVTARFLPQRLDVRQASHLWLGPYVTFQQGHFSIDGAGYDPGTPLDPWGNPYYLFTPVGLVRPTLGTVTLELYGDQFDRYAIVCLAGDGVMSDDDLIVFFGSPPFGLPSQTTISSLVPDLAAPGQQVTVRGYNFGSEQGDSELRLAGNPIASVVSWSDRAIVFDVPRGARSGEVVVVRPFQQSNGMLLRVLARAAHWSLYR